MLILDTSETGIEEDLEDTIEDLAGDMGDLKTGAENLEDLEDWRLGLRT